MSDVHKSILATWPKEAGPKPTQKDIKLIQEAGLAKVGSKTTLAIAMSIREHGATQDQITKVLGHPYRNALTRLVTTGQATREHVPSNGRNMVYKLTLKVAS